MESKGDLRTDMYASASTGRGLSAASDVENQGSGDSSSHGGSLPSCSSSSERNSSNDLIDGAAEAIATLEDGEVRTMLQDPEVCAVLRKVTINEGVLNMTIQSLGGGEKGLQSLMEYIMVWMKQQRNIQPSSQQLLPSNPAWNFSTAQNVDLQPSSDAFEILSGILQPPPTMQLFDQEMRYTQRLKSRKLMTGEPEMDAGLGGVETGFCPSSFISTPEDCKPDLMAPCIFQEHIAMSFAEPTPAMAKKAARRHRMSRQRQSFHARAASSAATAHVSEGGGSLWKTNAAPSPAVTSSGMSRAQTPPPRARVAATREPRSMECLTFVLQKELRPSDVRHLGRVVLPKKDAELRMPPLATREGVSIEMEDFDSDQIWNLKFRFWPNNRSRMYVLENTAEFVTVHGLVEGDLLVIYRVLQGGYVVRGLKKKNGRLDVEPAQVDFAYSSAIGAVEGQPSLHENGSLVHRQDKCFLSHRHLYDDPLLDDVILSMGPSLEVFPSLSLDFPFEEIMAVIMPELDQEPDGR